MFPTDFSLQIMSDPKYSRWQKLRTLVGQAHPSKSSRDRDALTATIWKTVKDDEKAYELKVTSLRQALADREAKKLKMWQGFLSCK